MKRCLLLFTGILILGLVWTGLVSQVQYPARAAIQPASTVVVAAVTPVLPSTPAAASSTQTIYLPFIGYTSPTPNPTNTPTHTPSPTPSGTPRPSEEFLVCSSPAAAIPDNTSVGLRDDITLNLWGILTNVEVYVRITHPFIGDLAVELNQRSTTNHLVLLDRPGLQAPVSLRKASKTYSPEGSYRCAYPNIQAIFSVRGSQPANNKCQTASRIGAAIGGIFTPLGDLSQLVGSPASGTYSLLVADNGAGDTGKLDKWCLHGRIGDVLPTPAPTPAPTQLPDSAYVAGMSGKGQALPLDCESRSAVDWARHFGVYIDELSFFNALPTSNDPDEGFVGSVYGGWGNIPPNAYGVHAGPVAALLRTYGLNAEGRAGWTFDELRAQIAAGNPVEVWIAGHVDAGGPEFFPVPPPDVPLSTHISTVARFEHTVIAYGYTPTTVRILDGGSSYDVSIDRFLDSWSTLRNMAVMMK